MPRLFILAISMLLLKLASAEEVDEYFNHSLISLRATNDNHLEALIDFYDEHIHVLKRSMELNETTEMIVPANKIALVQKFAEDNLIELEIKEKSYRRKHCTFGCNMPDLSARTRLTYDSIRSYLKGLQKANKDLVRLKYIGKSSNERPIDLVIISRNPKAELVPKIFVVAGTQANEWITTKVAIDLIDRLIARKNGPELDGVNWYILPLVNPDGYEYSLSKESRHFWRKTRSRHLFKTLCYGVDINKNFDFQWNGKNSSSKFCREQNYAGPRPFSEPETQMVQRVMIDHYGCLRMFISLHAFGEYILHPYSYTNRSLPEAFKEIEALAIKVGETVTKKTGKEYAIMKASKYNYMFGSSIDYAFTVIDVKYSYMWSVNESVREFDAIFAGFRVLCEHIKKEYS